MSMASMGSIWMATARLMVIVSCPWCSSERLVELAAQLAQQLGNVLPAGVAGRGKLQIMLAGQDCRTHVVEVRVQHAPLPPQAGAPRGAHQHGFQAGEGRSEERRVGKEGGG